MDFLRRRRLDLFLAALAIVQGIAIVSSDQPSKPAVAVVTCAAALVLIARHWQPLVAVVLAFGGLAAGLALMPAAPTPQFFGLMVTFAFAGGITINRDAVIGWCVGAALLVVGWSTTDQAVADVLLTLAFCSVMWVAGWFVSRRTRQAEVMSLRARAADQERIIALRDERSRIARELHDVVSHGLSVVVLQTLAARGALADLVVRDAGEVERHLDAVESSARDALAEMRRMLGLLQVEDLSESELAAPSPGLRHISVLIERARTAGLDVDAAIRPGEPAISPGLELAIYRVVQEALTNVVKHAPGAHVTVAIGTQGGDVVVEVIDDGGEPAATGGPGLGDGGHGLVGMRERVALYGGQLAVGARLQGGFGVRAAFPRQDQAAIADVEPQEMPA